MSTRRTPLDTRTIRRIAVAADADPRTVRRALQGARIHGAAVAERIAYALVALGLAPLAPERAPTVPRVRS